MCLTELFCIIDDFCKIFLPKWNKILIKNGVKSRCRQTKLTMREIMTILILFHQSGFRNFKTFYTQYVCANLNEEFPHLLSYSRFVTLIPSALIPLCAYAQSKRGESRGISFIDSTSIKVCHNIRINRNKVFKGIAQRGKTSMGWFFGFKLHFVISDKGEILNFCITPGNVNDRDPVQQLSQGLTGKLFGDKGYLSQKLFQILLCQGLKLVTTIRKNMKNKFMPLVDKLLLRKRFIIETINDQLKNISQIEHSRHRSVANFMVNLLAGLSAYIMQPKKPSIKCGHPFLAQNLAC